MNVRLTLLSLAIISIMSCGSRTAPPNIVLIVADDLGWGDVGYNGSEIRTPEIDRLVADGVKLDRFYTHPNCSPTRAALMTGRSPFSTGVREPLEPWFANGLPLEEKIMPQYFRAAGYQTFAVGKWHLGPNKKSYYPQHRGFDHFYGHIGGFINYYMHTAWRRLDWQRNGVTVEEEGYSTHLKTAEAVDLIRRRDTEKPMFLYLSYNAPHSPLQAPPEAIEAYSSIEDKPRRTYAAMVTEMDKGIGEVRAALEEQGLLQDTLLFFMSDNGGQPGLGARNSPLRGQKGLSYEGGIRVPAVMRWPSMLPGGSSFDQRLVVEDILPTFLSAAGVIADYPKKLDGRDLWPALAHGERVEPRPAVLARGGGPEVPLLCAYLDGDWKLVQSADRKTRLPIFQLFRITEDPFEEHDLAADFPEVVSRMRKSVEVMPKAAVIGIGANRARDFGFGVQSGAGSILPDETPATGTPYAESEWRNFP